MPTLEAAQPSRTATPEARSLGRTRGSDDRRADRQASFRLVSVGGGCGDGRCAGSADLGKETREPYSSGSGRHRSYCSASTTSS